MNAHVCALLRPGLGAKTTTRPMPDSTSQLHAQQCGQLALITHVC